MGIIYSVNGEHNERYAKCYWCILCRAIERERTISQRIETATTTDSFEYICSHHNGQKHSKRDASDYVAYFTQMSRIDPSSVLWLSFKSKQRKKHTKNFQKTHTYRENGVIFTIILCVCEMCVVPLVRMRDSVHTSFGTDFFPSI